MKVFNKRVSRYKVLLCTSVLINLLLLVAVGIEEKYSHVFESALVRRGYIQYSKDLDKKLPDYWARMGWQNTIEKLHTDFDIAFFGNSITRGSDFQLAYPDKKIINLGYSGDNMIGMLRRVPMIQKAKPKKVFIMAGTNDLVHIDLDEYKSRYENLISAIQNAVPQAHIYIQSVLPSNHEISNYASNKKVMAANEIAKDLSEKYECTYIDLYSLYANNENELPKELTRDGVHLYPEHYKKWEEKIRPFIYE